MASDVLRSRDRKTLKMVGTGTKGRRWKARILMASMACATAGIGAYLTLAEHRTMIGLWFTPDQQGRYYFQKSDYRAAGERFQDPLWKGIAYYRSKDFEAAVEQFARVDTPEGYFNLGDAYARAGRLEQAVSSYEETLRRKPDDRAAKENRDLVRSLIEKKKAKEKEEEAPEGQEPTFNPDEIKFDEKGKKGKPGEVDQAQLSAEQIQEMWMRRLQTTPSDFLRLKFAGQVEESRRSGPRGQPHGGN